MSDADPTPGLPSLLLVPGLLCDRAVWQHQVEGLADLARCEVADVAGHDSVEAIARAALEVAPARFALAGISMGGYVALEIVRQAPDRVTRLALVDTQPRQDDPEQAGRRRELVRATQAGGFDGVVDGFPRLALHHDHLEDDALVGEFVAMAHRVGAETFLRQQAAIIGRPDSVPSLHEIDCPTLVVCGRQDQITPLEGSELMAATVPGARLAVIEECGHMSTMEAPDTVTDLLREWLRDWA